MGPEMRKDLVFAFLLASMYPVLLVGSYECVPGERWYENCKKCTCRTGESFSCQFSSCLSDQCIAGSLWFNREYRCHCGLPGGRPRTVCVRMIYQPDLNKKPCEPLSYIYDTCNMCICDPSTNLTKCYEIEDCKKSTGGVCQPGSIKMENCYKCRCTHTRFRICTYQKECFNNKKKNGSCAAALNSNYFNNICPFQQLFARQQECYTDYGCPGTKKCCRSRDCTLRCTNPTFDKKV